MQVKITKLPGSCIEIEGELTYEEFAKNEEVAIKNLSAILLESWIGSFSPLSNPFAFAKVPHKQEHSPE